MGGGLFGQGAHLVGLRLVGKGEGGGVIQRHGDVPDKEHPVFQVVGQLLVGEGGLAVFAVEQLDQRRLLEEVLLIAAQALLPDAVGGVQLAVVFHQLAGVLFGLVGVGGAQLLPELGKAGLDGGKAPQVVKGLVRHIVADRHRLAPVGGDGLSQEGLDVGGVLFRPGQLGGLLIGVELGQQIQPRGDVDPADGAHAVGGGDVAARKGHAERQQDGQRGECFFHRV